MSVSVVRQVQAGRTITVGGACADIAQFTSAAVQQAADALKARGGGTIRLNAGVYSVEAPIRLYSGTALLGEEGAVLRKCGGFHSAMAIDADYGELVVTVADAGGFRPGMGVQVLDSSSGGWDVSTAVVSGVDGCVLTLDRYLVKDYVSGLNGGVSNACSLVEAVEAENVTVSGLSIEGNGQANDYLNGCRGGAVYFHKAVACTAENLRVSGFNGDGISWQITEDIAVRCCEVWGCAGFGMHPGTGSVRSVVQGCRIHGNGSDGIFVCWRVRNGRFAGNDIHSNGGSGVNIGHKDTDNVFEGNRIRENAFCGVYHRPESDTNGAHRNVYCGNTIEDNGGGGEGYGILVDSYAEDLVVEGNVIRDTGRGAQKAGIFLRGAAPGIRTDGNDMGGHALGDVISA